MLIPFSRQNNTNAMIRKLTSDERNAEAKPATSCNVYVCPPVTRFKIGLIKLSVNEVTIPEKALPMITPTACPSCFPAMQRF